MLLRYGLNADGSFAVEPPQTQEQVAQLFGLSRERVRQIESEAVRRMGADVGLPDMGEWWRRQVAQALPQMQWRELQPSWWSEIDTAKQAREIVAARGGNVSE